MSTYVIWVEMNRSKIFRVDAKSEGGPKVLHRSEILHHTSSDPEKHKDTEGFFHRIARELAGAKEIFLVGPGLAKDHFREHLDRHHHRDLAKAVVGSVTMDHPSDEQVLARSREFFREYDLYGQKERRA